MAAIAEINGYFLIAGGALLGLVAYVLCVTASWEEPEPPTVIDSPLWTEEAA